jgi:hypothetical protein
LTKEKPGTDAFLINKVIGLFHEVPKKYETNNSQQHFINNPQNVGAECNVHIFLECRHSQQMSYIV